MRGASSQAPAHPQEGKRRVETGLNTRLDGDVVILSDFGGLLNDPRHFDAGRDVRGLLDEGVRNFVLELAGVREMGTTALGLLVTITRQVRQAGGDVALARPGRVILRYLDELRMDDYWDVAGSVEEAKGLPDRTPA